MSANNAVFMSYRRADSQPVVGRIHDWLAREFGRGVVFRDVDDMPYGNFRQFVVKKMEMCLVALIVIGPGWLNARQPDGSRRLDDPEDLLRIEIETALSRLDKGLTVIPLLVMGAKAPTKDELPLSLQALADQNAASIGDDPHFHHDMDKLADWLRHAGAKSEEEIAEQRPAAGAAGIWESLKDSDDIADLERFARNYQGRDEAFEALRRIDKLKKEAATWAAVNWKDLASIDEFMRLFPTHPHIDIARKLRKGVWQQVENARAIAEATAQRKREEQAKKKAQADKLIGDTAKTAGKIGYGVYSVVVFVAILLGMVFVWQVGKNFLNSLFH